MKNITLVDALSSDEGEYLVNLSELNPSFIVEESNKYLEEAGKILDLSHYDTNSKEYYELEQGENVRKQILTNLAGIEKIYNSKKKEKRKNPTIDNDFLRWATVNLMVYELVICYMKFRSLNIDSLQPLQIKIGRVIVELMKSIDGIINEKKYNYYLKNLYDNFPLATAIADSLQSTCSTLSKHYYKTHVKKQEKKYDIFLFSCKKEEKIALQQQTEDLFKISMNSHT